jgi:hypothetical protein
MDDYLSKPIELQRLRVLVARWLGGGQFAADANDQVGGATADLFEVAAASVD